MTDTTDIPEGGPDVMAGEYVLGVLEGADRAAAERRFETDPHFVAEVAAWERRLAPLIESLGDEQPSPAVWRRIVAELALAEPGARRAPVVRRAWNSLPVWRGLTAVSAAAAAACLVVIVNPGEPTPPVVAPPAQPGPMAVALLKPEAGPAVFVVTLDKENGRMIIMPVTVVGAPEHTPELWLLPKDGAAPVSLGLLDTGRALVLPTSKLGADDLSAALAVSMEPRGGSPTGQPTGPVVAQGKLSAL